VLTAKQERGLSIASTQPYPTPARPAADGIAGHDEKRSFP